MLKLRLARTKITSHGMSATQLAVFAGTALFQKWKMKSESVCEMTMEKMSLDALITLLEHPDVKNVYFHPSVAPPGSGVDGIALRYRVYFEFN